MNLTIEGKNFLTIFGNGDVLIRGRKVGTDKGILEGLHAFLKSVQENQKATNVLLTTPPKGEA